MKNKMIKILVVFAFVYSAQSVLAEAGSSLNDCKSMTAPAEKGYCFSRYMDRLPVIEKQISMGKLKIYDSQGNLLFTKKTRDAAFNENYKNPDTRLRRTISYFYAPADDKGNSSLIKEIQGDDDDQFIYLKGLRKPKRIIGSDKSSSYMGSDFSNGDLSRGKLDDYNYLWLGNEKLTTTFSMGKKSKKVTFVAEKIEGSFKSPKKREDYGYSKSIIWSHPQTGLMLKVENYNLSGHLHKEVRTLKFTVKKNKDGKKIYLPTELIVKNINKGTQTIMQVSKIKVEQKASKITSSIFKTSYLTRRWW